MGNKEMHILLAEDDASINHHLSEFLVENGFINVHTVYSKAEAFAWLSNRRPDAAILDIEMEERYAGIDIGNELMCKNIPVIFLTSHSDVDILRRIEDARFAVFLSKPFRANELLTNLKLLLNEVQKTENAHSASIKSEMSSSAVYFEIVQSGIARKIYAKDIVFVKSENVYMELNTAQGKRYLIRSTMVELITKLPNHFARIHRSYVVNLAKVTRRSGKNLYAGEIRLPLSNSYKSNVMERLSAL